MHLIFCLNVLNENMFFKTEEQFQIALSNSLLRKMIDWNWVIIVKHLQKNLFSEGWALWAKLDTGQKKIAC